MTFPTTSSFDDSYFGDQQKLVLDYDKLARAAGLDTDCHCQYPDQDQEIQSEMLQGMAGPQQFATLPQAMAHCQQMPYNQGMVPQPRDFSQVMANPQSMHYSVVMANPQRMAHEQNLACFQQNSYLHRMTPQQIGFSQGMVNPQPLHYSPAMAIPQQMPYPLQEFHPQGSSYLQQPVDYSQGSNYLHQTMAHPQPVVYYQPVAYSQPSVHTSQPVDYSQGMAGPQQEFHPEESSYHHQPMTHPHPMDISHPVDSSHEIADQEPVEDSQPLDISQEIADQEPVDDSQGTGYQELSAFFQPVDSPQPVGDSQLMVFFQPVDNLQPAGDSQLTVFFQPVDNSQQETAAQDEKPGSWTRYDPRTLQFDPVYFKVDANVTSHDVFRDILIKAFGLSPGSHHKNHFTYLIRRDGIKLIARYLNLLKQKSTEKVAIPTTFSIRRDRVSRFNNEMQTWALFPSQEEINNGGPVENITRKRKEGNEENEGKEKKGKKPKKKKKPKRPKKQEEQEVQEKRITALEESWNIIASCHQTGSPGVHRNRDETWDLVKIQTGNLPKEIATAFVYSCPGCQSRIESCRETLKIRDQAKTTARQVETRTKNFLLDNADDPEKIAEYLEKKETQKKRKAENGASSPATKRSKSSPTGHEDAANDQDPASHVAPYSMDQDVYSNSVSHNTASDDHSSLWMVRDYLQQEDAMSSTSGLNPDLLNNEYAGAIPGSLYYAPSDPNSGYLNNGYQLTN